MQVANDTTTWTLDSTLRGAAIDLPPPMAKPVNDAVPLKIQRKVTDPGHDSLSIRYGALGHLNLQRRLTPAGAVTERALLALGATEGDADRRGLWLRSGLPGDPRKYRVPRAQRFGVIHVVPEGAELVPYAVDRGTFNTFLRCREVWEWTQGPAKEVVGKPLKKETAAA
jgi:hypothetical protein